MPRRIVTPKVASGLLKNPNCSIVFFRTTSCPHCISLAKKVEDLLKADQTNIDVYDACPELGTPIAFFEKFGFNTVPHLVLLQAGKIVSLKKKSECCDHLRKFINKALRH